MKICEIMPLVESDSVESYCLLVRKTMHDIFHYVDGFNTDETTDADILAMRATVQKLVSENSLIYRLFTAPPSFVKSLKPGDRLSSSNRYSVASWTTDFSEMDIQTLHVDDVWSSYSDDQGDQNPLFIACGISSQGSVNQLYTVCQRLEMPWENEVAANQGQSLTCKGIFSANEHGGISLGKQVRPDLIGKTMTF